MGQKTNPRVLRIGITRAWDSKWYASKKDFAKLFHQDLLIRKLIQGMFKEAAVSRVEISRSANRVMIAVFSGRPGLIIGRQGEGINLLRDELEKKFGQKFAVTVREIEKSSLDAYLLACSIAEQVEKRISYRRACKTAIEKAFDSGAIGVKIEIGGRLNGVEISRSEFFSRGKIPLHTFRADIDYAYVPAKTTYGTIGVKTWIYKGEVFERVSPLQSS